MEHPILTIAIPTYNRADLLDLCLDRVFNQLSPHETVTEVLVSNNASTEHTWEVVKKYQNQYSQLRYAENESNTGPDFNIAKCFELASAKYVWVFSDDDLLLPHAFDYVIQFLREQEVGVLFLEPRFYRKSIQEFVSLNEPFSYKIYEDPFEALKEQHYWITYISGVITNKELVQNSPTLYQFQKSFLIQLGWVLPALFQSERNAKITVPLVLGRSLEILDFKLFHVFGDSYPKVLSCLASSGAIPVVAKDLLIELIIKEYFPQYVKPGLKVPYGESPLYILSKSFWKRRSFWTTIVPLFLRREYVPLISKMKKPIKSGIKKIVGKS